jgi:AbrB family looped-hinge helix DNA binding protein
MSDETVMVRVSETGRISIPAKQRKAVGLEEGGLAVARVDHGEIRIRPVRTVLAELQAKVRRHLANSGESVDRFLADRHEEASREDG